MPSLYLVLDQYKKIIYKFTVLCSEVIYHPIPNRIYHSQLQFVSNMQIRMEIVFLKCPVMIILEEVSICKMKMIYDMTGNVNKTT